MEDLALSKSSHLTHQELLRRRLHRLRRLSGVYRDHYWALMEDLRVHYREYYWKYGISPCKEEDERESGGGDREFAGAQQGPILCGRPILKSTVPSLCNIHFPKAQKDVKHALKKAGLNVSSSSKLAPKFHVIIAEYVNLIQSKRRAAQKHNGKSVVVKEESAC
uniref:KAT8 regulatory NSL complex subunit 2 n=1 Tax=Chenopodium quinoa TaxID=63459 RepID=A0A803KU92_CHEQI